MTLEGEIWLAQSVLKAYRGNIYMLTHVVLVYLAGWS